MHNLQTLLNDTNSLNTVYNFDLSAVDTEFELHKQVFKSEPDPLSDEDKQTLLDWSDKYAKENKPLWAKTRKSKRKAAFEAAAKKVYELQEKSVAKLKALGHNAAALAANAIPNLGSIVVFLIIVYYALRILWLWTHWN